MRLLRVKARRARFTYHDGAGIFRNAVICPTPILWVCTTNCNGVLSTPTEQLFSVTFPEMATRYSDECYKGNYTPGMLRVYRVRSNAVLHDVACLAMRDAWHTPPQYMWFRMGLQAVKDIVLRRRFRTVMLPVMDCVAGGLSLKTIKFMVENELVGVDADIHVFTVKGGVP